MTAKEICKKYMSIEDKQEALTILSDFNDCTKAEIVELLGHMGISVELPRKTSDKELVEETPISKDAICMRCKQEPVGGSGILCPVCEEIVQSQRKMRYWKSRAHVIDIKHAQYQERKEQGICVRCGKNPVYITKEKKYTYCYECVMKDRERKKKAREKKKCLNNEGVQHGIYESKYRKK